MKTVLSLFDGMSCGQIALNKHGVKYDKYYASEIDKWAIQICQKNYPDTIQLGDVTEWKDWDIAFEDIDLVLAGSPCQGFSVQGGKLAFDHPQSKLFFEFLEILNHIKTKNPNVKFILENVRMKKEYEDIITDYVGVNSIAINSALVSAQNRLRYYWTNISDNIEQPNDKGIIIEDILDASIDTADLIEDATYKPKYQYFYNRGERDSLCQQVGLANINGYDSIKRVYSVNGKSPCLVAQSGGNTEAKLAINGSVWRAVTPLECERLQTVPDEYTAGVSDTQRRRMLGNGWNVDTIVHILESGNLE